MTMDCAACHLPESWDIPASFWKANAQGTQEKISNSTGMPLPSERKIFHHDDTNFPLEGQHVGVNCRDCHPSLIFSRAESDCISCHTDIHRNTVGEDCRRCHSTGSWLVDNVIELHAENGFPLLGAHAVANCNDCHISESRLEFNRIGNACINCHDDDFAATVNPNHQDAGFSFNCQDCHQVEAIDWTAKPVEHDFFPLTKGHDLEDCNSCHNGGPFNQTPTNCFACHQTDFESAVNPNHLAANFSNDCAACHTTDPDWVPAVFAEHDALHFPIYSGAHAGVWNQCAECHLNPSDYAEFSCVVCHLNPETDEAHEDVNGYVYQDNACLACHPTGDADNVFDHNQTNFPLTGAHITVNCLDCHSAGFQGTPTACASCHTQDFNDASNPNHIALGLSTDCASCHTTAPGWAPATFDNHNDYYALNGAHAAIANDCAACHNGDYNNTPNTCVGCHLTDFNQTTDPDHEAAQFPTDCASCHTESAWAPSTFNHDDHYPLTGAHAAIANECASCHIGGNYTSTPNTCAGCHTEDFNQASNPNHVALGLSTDCASCHTTAPGWAPATFDNHNDYYALNGAHAAIANDCAACHNGDYNNTPNTCVGCHLSDFNSTTDPDHETAQFSTDCTSCHSESAWMPSTFDHDAQYFPIYSGAHEGVWNQCTECHLNPSNYAEFTCIGCHTNPETDEEHEDVGGYVYQDNACLACHPTGDADNVFDHNQTNFPLTGAHIMVNCLDCHSAGFQGTPTACASCHTQDFNDASNPNHIALGFSTDCASCHTTAPGWAPATFDNHNDYYALNGAHAAIANDCAACHNGDYNNTPNTCVGCHLTDFNQTTDPDHEAAQFPTDCASCHTESAWAPSTFNHDDHYPLTGAHAAIANECASCHIGGNYTNTPNTCAGCHTEDFNQASNPNHVALGLSTDCASCHTTAPGWAPATFDNHNDYYALNGAHAAIANDCATCHNGDYNNTPNTCVGCHLSDFNSTTDPDHETAQFSTDCTSCHSESAWMPSTFDHDAQYFPIYSGAHEGVWNQCTECHLNPSNYAEFTCIGCHTNPETDEEHEDVGGYVYQDNACLACHPTGDADNVFDHNQTNFPLTGAHITVNCLDCHSAGFQGTPTACASCHTQDFNDASNPNHIALGLSTDCASCHTTAPGWAPATFDNHNDYYALNGAHAAIANDCATCHNGDYNNTPNTCVGCHLTDFNQTTDPDHEAAQFPTDCASCHTETAWAPSTFNHDDHYPLTGAHAAIANECASCHIGGNYTNTPNTCAGCHTEDFNQASNPNHVALGFSTDCASCHTTAPGWAPATFDNHNDYYALNGAHAAIANDCATCHNGDYINTPNTCVGCHQVDYNQTTNPDHEAAQFSTDCASCHGETSWVPSTFEHDAQYFPIYSGSHEGVWNQCTECHFNPSDYAQFTCIGCHTNPDTDEEHEDVGGYVYQDNACLACHPTGDADNVFDHNQTSFSLTGAHAMVNCLECHAAGFAGTSTACASCHTEDFNLTANPNHSALGFSTDCASCHTTAPGWAPATFDNHNDYYALNGAHAAIANDCAACHNGDYNNTPNTCVGCHQTDFNQTTDPDHEAAQFPTDCASCHTESAWAPSTFNHDDHYPLTGAHAAIANECASCHIGGNYTNTPNTCAGCHTEDFNQTANPNHSALGFSTDCASCHTTAPGWAPATFDNHNDYYALNGAHAAIANDCAACHNGDYNNTPNTCVGCHLTDFNQTTDPDHEAAQFPTDCASCHTESAWAPSTFNHDDHYPLTGAHAAIANECASCHIGGNYTSTPNTCAGCHTEDFNQTANPNHSALGFSTDCASCHTTAPGWAPATFDNHNDYYALNGAHAAIANDCAACHNGDYNNTPNTCVGCHLTDFNQTTDPDHEAAQFPTDCASCHTESAWAPSTFDHDAFYPLNGAHAAIANDCAACHLGGNYTNTPNTCVGCHQTDFNQTTDPDHEAAQFPTDCASCHTESAWAPATFDHDVYYPLTGAHAAIANECAACHIGGNYTNTPNTCAGCHTEDFNQTANPNHSALGFSTDCASCHTTAPGWAPATFDNHNDYYALNGAHAAIANDCAACHNGDYNNTPNTCVGCHLTDFNQTTDPDHEAAQFPTDCASCHTESAWAPATFDHDAFYPLNGAHAAIANDCAACHLGGNYTNTPNTCVGCHQTDFNQTTDPDHEAAQFPTDCASCHTESAWAPATFDHDVYYPLTGAHAAIANECAACHIGGNYTNTPNTCAGCHTEDFNQTANPNHSALGFSTDCVSCHTTAPGWAPATFDNHNDYYALNGAHAAIANDCAACHNGDYNNTPNTCVGCHLTDFNQTTDPDHEAAQFPTDCASCHTETAWVPATFDHDYYYPLDGGHALVANECLLCHVGGNYSNTPNTCAGCHTSDYNQAGNPNHVALGLSTDCASCHTTAPDWAPATFAIHNSFYPLNGAHAAIANDCAACHNGNYNNTPNTCFGCHAQDYSNATNPNHTAAQFSTDCTSCHSENAWVPSTFDHDNFYPLIGAHAAIANNCVACHVGGNYNNTPNTCYGCHAQDYNSANDPNHQSAGFPFTCESCHSQNAWTPSTFNHDDMYFPIYSGTHNGEWDNCNDCHTTPGNFAVFSCIDCHEHDNPNELANDHEDVSGYVYQSSACYACHPTGDD